MSTNGNGKWFHSTWTKKGGRVNPTKSGWYAAVPDDCDKCVTKVWLDGNLLDVYVEGNDLKYDVYDFEWWFPLKTPYDQLPKFRE